MDQVQGGKLETFDRTRSEAQGAREGGRRRSAAQDRVVEAEQDAGRLVAVALTLAATRVGDGPRALALDGTELC